MVKKNYVMPASNTNASRLRTNILAGSSTAPGFGGQGGSGNISIGGGSTPSTPQDENQEVGGEARRRSRSSLD